MQDITIQIWLLKIRSYIADKEMISATANKELAMGGWLSDHREAIKSLDEGIEYYIEEINKNL